MQKLLLLIIFGDYLPLCSAVFVVRNPQTLQETYVGREPLALGLTISSEICQSRHDLDGMRPGILTDVCVPVQACVRAHVI